MSKAGFMQRPLWISASAITDAYTVNTLSASYLDAATEAMNPIPYEETQKNSRSIQPSRVIPISEYKAITMFFQF